VKAVRLLGQDLVLFRDGRGSGACRPRLSAPRRRPRVRRLEPEGLRCPFHGWKFAVDGTCLETPAEPPARRCARGSASAAIRCRSRSASSSPGWAPRARCRRRCRRSTPSSPRRATASPSRACGNCNWLQAFEVGIDPAHPSFLHRYLEDESSLEAAYGRQFRAASAGEVGGERWPMTRVMREFCQPEIRFESVADGLLRLTTLRPMTDELTHVRVTHAAFPRPS
jgi:phenylpropionate dioxygenase-like ring-hydroxylating dioxygenase large terminal subunit